MPESLRRLATEGLTDPSKCKVEADRGYEDVEMGRCLKAVGVRDGDSRDNLGRFRFLPFTPAIHITHRRWSSAGFWYWSYVEHEEQQVPGLTCRRIDLVGAFSVSPRTFV